MVPDYELAEAPLHAPRPGLVVLQDQEELTVVRCRCCGGLRSTSRRRMKEVHPYCVDCRRGDIYTRETFHAFWRERFTDEEIVEMSRAIFG